MIADGIEFLADEIRVALSTNTTIVDTTLATGRNEILATTS